MSAENPSFEYPRHWVFDGDGEEIETVDGRKGKRVGTADLTLPQTPEKRGKFFKKTDRGVIVETEDGAITVVHPNRIK